MNEDKLLQELLDDLEDESEADDEPEQGEVVRLMVRVKKGETVDDASARAVLTPEYSAAGSIFQLNQVSAFKQADLTKLADRLEYQTQQIKDGDLGQAESMLASQAHTLDAIFHHLLHRFSLNAGKHIEAAEKYMKLALKAQSQCRTTLDSLASMKNPPPELIKQTNIAHGHQQVNNFPKEIDGENELKELADGERLDAGTPSTAISGDQTLETVEAKHRAKDT